MSVLCLCIGLLAGAVGELTALPVRLTYYTPDAGGINCDGDCRYLADGEVWTAQDIGRVAACPAELFYRRITTPIGELHCRDRGGAIKIVYDRYYRRMVIPIDVLWSAALEPPGWNYTLGAWSFVRFVR